MFKIWMHLKILYGQENFNFIQTLHLTNKILRVWFKPALFIPIEVSFLEKLRLWMSTIDLCFHHTLSQNISSTPILYKIFFVYPFRTMKLLWPKKRDRHPLNKNKKSLSITIQDWCNCVYTELFPFCESQTTTPPSSQKSKWSKSASQVILRGLLKIFSKPSNLWTWLYTFQSLHSNRK